jgi:YVTN family beta-propeller protein
MVGNIVIAVANIVASFLNLLGQNRWLRFVLVFVSANSIHAGEDLSPTALVVSPDGTIVYVACGTAGLVKAVNLANGEVTASIHVPPRPTGLALSADGNRLFVTCASPKSDICVVDLARAKVTAKFSTGHSAISPVLSPDGKTLFICNRFNDDVSVLEIATGKELRRIAVTREPVAAAITPDGRHLLVANHLPAGRADQPPMAAVVSIIDVSAGRVVKELRLPNGSGSLQHIRISPDGKYAVVTHILARFGLPTTQLDRGWMNTNTKTIIAVDRLEVLNTVLLDDVDRGAANPWGVAWSADGRKLVVAHAGTHEVSVTDFPGLLERLAKLPAAPPANAAGDYSRSSHSQADVPNDLAFLVGLRQRLKLPAGDLGPRALVVAGSHAITANYFSDSLTVIDLAQPQSPTRSIALGPKSAMGLVRRGEFYFNDAGICFQGWQSCASCHPGDGRVDGLNWDLLNDGIGNPKNNKSLLLAHKTPPAMSTGIRDTAETAVRAGIRHILFTVQPPGVADALDAWLKSLEPVPSPHLEKGKLSPAARRGEKLFRSREAGCAQCHPAPLFTDLNSYAVGTVGPFDRGQDLFDTPTLVELWRTAPYLHDGSAATIRDVLTTRNPQNGHGNTSQLTPAQVEDLVAYLLSL